MQQSVTTEHVSGLDLIPQPPTIPGLHADIPAFVEEDGTQHRHVYSYLTRSEVFDPHAGDWTRVDPRELEYHVVMIRPHANVSRVSQNRP